MSHLPILLSLAAGACFGLLVHAQHAAIRMVPPLTATLIMIGTMASMFWILSPFYLDLADLGRPGVVYFALAGLMFPAFAQLFQMASVRRVGPALTSAIGAFAPGFAVIPAVLVLGEDMNAQGVLGLLLLIVGLAIAPLRSGRVPRDWPLAVLLLPLGAAFVRGIANVLSKMGLATIPNPFFATLVTISVSVSVVFMLWLVRGRSGRPAGFPKGGGWFVLAGLLLGTGILCLHGALSLGDVTVAAALVSTTPLWALLFGVVIFRREAVGVKQVVLAGLVVVGAVLVVTR